MAVGFKVDCFWYQVGQGEFLHSFFSTISYRLEPDGWGTRFPEMLNELYNGKIIASNINKALDELRTIKNELSKFKPLQVVWDIEDLTKQPPWGKNISEDITSLADYFITSDGRDLFEVLDNALNTALKYKFDIEIKSI